MTLTRQPRCITDDNVIAPAEQVRQVFAALAVDRDTERNKPLPASIQQRIASILDTIAAFILIEVVRLAVGKYQ